MNAACGCSQNSRRVVQVADSRYGTAYPINADAEVINLADFFLTLKLTPTFLLFN